MSETPADRARRFFDETPEPEGTVDELIDGLRQAQADRIEGRAAALTEDPS